LTMFQKVRSDLVGVTTVCFMIVLALGLLSLTSGKLEIAGFQYEYYNRLILFPNRDLFDTALLLFSIGALGLIIPLFLDRINLHNEKKKRNFSSLQSLKDADFGTTEFFFLENWKMNSRLWVLQLFLVLSTLMGWIIFPDLLILGAIYFKLIVRLILSFSVVGLLKKFELVPKECHFWSGFDPRVWYKVALNKYQNPFDTAAMSAVIGIDLLGMGYAFLHVPMISDPVFTIGSFYLALFALRGYLVTKELILAYWTILNLGLYTTDGLINCYITFFL